MKNISDLKELTKKFDPAMRFIKRYVSLIFILLIVIVLGFLVMRIGQLANAEPTQEAIDLKLSEVKRTKIDQSAIDKIQQLKDQNIQVQTLFQQARDNPFKD